MPTIGENRLFTVLVEWEVDPQHQQELIDSICDQIEPHIKSDTAFVSASFHASEDGRRVINYGQWRSKKTGVDLDDGATAAIAEVISRYGAKTVKVDTFRVARVVENV